MVLRSPEQSGFFIRNVDGLGPVKASISTSEVFTIDGSLFNSARANSRNIVLNLGFMNDYESSIESLRQNTYRYFPLKQLVTIEVETDNRIGVTDGYVESNEPDIFSEDSGTTISLLCPSAYFHARETVQTYFSGATPSFEFPFENPSLTLKLIEFGSVFINTTANVFYTGDVPTGVYIAITFLGAVTDPIIHNLYSGENMSFSSAKLTALTGFNFKAGDVVLISTVKGDKYVRLIRGAVVWNIIGVIDTLSDWFTIVKGDNAFSYTATSGLANMQFYIEHQVLYQGV